MSELVQVTVGDITCTVIQDGGRQPDFDTLMERFGNVAAEDLQAELDAHHPDGVIEWSMNCVLLQTGDDAVLVDTGTGPGFNEAYGQTLGHVSSIIDPAQVTRVVISHVHGDHINGLFNEDGGLIYPNADVAMHPAEKEFWLARDLSAYGEGAVAQREKMHTAINDRLVLLEDGNIIAPGISAVLMAGHTPGHLGFLVKSGGEKLFGVVDALHYEVQTARPEWSIVFDNDREEAAATRRKLMARAVYENLLTLVYHFGYPGLGYFSQKGDAFGWTPYEKG